MLNKIKVYISERKDKKDERKRKRYIESKIGWSSKYFTTKDLMRMSDSAYTTIIPMYSNGYINIVRLEYKRHIEKLEVVVYFNDSGKDDYMLDLEKDIMLNKRWYKKYGRAVRITISVGEMNHYQGFDNLIKSRYKKYVEYEVKKKREVEEYRIKKVEESRRYI